MTLLTMIVMRALLVCVLVGLVLVASAAGEGKKKKKTKASSKVVQINPDNWDYIVKDIKKNVFVKFYTPWCRECKNMAAEWELLAEKYTSDTVIVAELDAEKYPQVAKKARVDAFPTLVLYPRTNKGGKFYMGERDLDHMGRFIRANPV